MVPHIDVSLWYVSKAEADVEPDWDQREFASVRWWSLEDLANADERFDPHTRRFIGKLRSRTDRVADRSARSRSGLS